MAGGADNTNSIYDPNNMDIQTLPNYTSGPNATPTTNGGGGGGPTPGVTQDGVPGFLQGVGQFLTGSNNPLTNSLMVPAVAMAAQQWNNANTYKQLGQDAADRADPFGKYRGYYGDMLQNLYKDPSQIENTPGYKFAMNQTMNATAAKLASQGLLGSSEMQNALAAQSSGLAQQTFNQERNALMQLSGSQFDPANAGRFMMQGGQLAVDAQNGALASLFAPFAMGINGRNGTGGGGQGQGGGASRAQAALQQAVSSGMINPQTAAQLFNKLMTSPGDITQGDLQIMQSLGIDTPFDTGGVDYAPGSYDQSGYGGWGTAAGDPTLTGINFGGNFDPSNFQDVTGQTGFDPGLYTDPFGDAQNFQTPTSDLFGPTANGGISFDNFLES